MDPNAGVRQDTLHGIPNPEPFVRCLLHPLAGVVVTLQAHTLLGTHSGTRELSFPSSARKGLRQRRVLRARHRRVLGEVLSVEAVARHRVTCFPSAATSGGKTSRTGGAGADIPRPIPRVNLKRVLKQCVWATLEVGIYVTLLAPSVLPSKQGLGGLCFRLKPRQQQLAGSHPQPLLTQGASALVGKGHPTHPGTEQPQKSQSSLLCRAYRCKRARQQQVERKGWNWYH